MEGSNDKTMRQAVEEYRLFHRFVVRVLLVLLHRCGMPSFLAGVDHPT